MYVPFGPGMGLVAPLLLIQATLVQFWAGATFYRTAWASARHGGTNTSTLVAVGTSAVGFQAFSKGGGIGYGGGQGVAGAGHDLRALRVERPGGP